jgi:hydrogenase maturation protein HypF
MNTLAFSLETPAPPVLALGAWFKNTVCAARGGEALLSPLVGDLDSAEACKAHEAAAAELCAWLGDAPRLIAHDLHPDFHSSRHAADLGAQLDVPLLPVQHHHAHIAAVCAEHGWRAPLLGIALDGVGLGTDGAAWGGELLQVDGAQCTRIGHLLPLALPGGDRAAREPWRMAAAAFHAQGRTAEIEARFAAVATPGGAAMVATMLSRNLNSPRTSSMGRVFDAAAGLLGICSHMKFEAEAAIALEQAATRHIDAHGWPLPMTDGWIIRDDQLDLLPILMRLDGAEEVEVGVGVDAAAAHFHATLVAALADWVMRAVERSSITTLAWSGGCFLNRLLSSGLKQNLEMRGITVLMPQRLSPGDACIAAGQAWVAIRHLEQ